MQLARANAAAAKARAERARQAAIAAQRSAAYYAGTRLASPGGVRGATQAGSVHYWRGFFYQQTSLDIFEPRYNVEVNAGGCVVGCLDGAIGYDSKYGPMSTVLGVEVRNWALVQESVLAMGSTLARIRASRGLRRLG